MDRCDGGGISRLPIDEIPVGVFVTDADGDYLAVNSAACAMVGYDREDLLSMSVADLIRTDASSVPTCEEVGRTGQVRTDAQLQHRDGHAVDVLLDAATVDDDRYVAYCQDVTESVRYERELEAQRDNLSVLNEVMRHDIRNDLQQVLGHADMLLDAVDEAHRPHVELILENAEEAVELTDTVRETAELLLTTERDHRPMDLARVVDTELGDVRDTLSDAVFVDETSLSGVIVRADKMLHSVFRNLLKNAVQHNDKTTPEVVVSSTVDDETVQVRVADNGPGIPDDRKTDIFGKGETGLESGGTGLGLYLVRTLVEGYGGTVRVEDGEPQSDASAGAAFVVELPRAG